MSVVLEKLREKAKIKLPKSGGTVWIWNELLTGDVREMMRGQNIDPNNPSVASDTGFKMIIRMIADWDFVDKDGNKLEINEENVDMLPMADITLISSKIGETNKGISEHLKKNTNNNYT